MRRFVVFSLFAFAVVAIPLSLDINGEHINHLDRRSSDSLIADVVKACIAFGAFIWGGGIISRRAINYYFDKKAELEKETARNRLMAQAKIQVAKPVPTTPAAQTLEDMAKSI